MPDRLPADFGRYLREARERRGMSLRQIATATKIGLSALEALERNDISRLPGGIFSRAFVRSYAVEVGLDPDATMHEFIAQFPQDSTGAGHPTSTHSEDHQAIDSDRRAATTFVRLIALSIPIAGALLYFGTAGRHAGRSSGDTQSGVDVSPTVQPTAAPVEPVPAPIETPALLPAVKPVSATIFPAERLTVGLLARRECWVSATVDGEKRVERLLQPGDQLVLDVHRELQLTAGDPSALTLTLNGAEAKPLGIAGKTATVRMNLTNFKDFVATR